VSGLRACHDRRAALVGPGRAIRQRLYADAACAGAAAAGRRRRVARLGLGLVSEGRLGRSRSDQRPAGGDQHIAVAYGRDFSVSRPCAA
jgi:hypothetical protein